MSQPVVLRLRPSGAPALAENILATADRSLCHADLQRLVDGGHGPYSSALGDELARLGWDVRELVTGVPDLIDAWEAEYGPLPSGPDRTTAYIFDAIRRWQPNAIIDTNTKFLSRTSIALARSMNPDLSACVATLGTPKGFAGALAADSVLVACPSFAPPLRTAGARSVHVLRHAFDPRVLTSVADVSISRPLVFSGSIGATGQGSRAAHLEALLEFTPIECWVSERLVPAETAAGAVSARLMVAQAHFRRAMLPPIGALVRMTGRRQATLDAAVSAHLTSHSKPQNWARSSPLASRFPGRIHPPVQGIAMYRLLKSAGIVFHHGVDNVGDCAGALRVFETTGIGSALLVDRTTDIAESFEPDREVATYGSPAECVAVARELIASDATRSSLGRAGAARALRDHTFAERAKTLHAILSDLVR